MQVRRVKDYWIGVAHVYDKNNEIVDVFVTTDKNGRIKRIPRGYYIIGAYADSYVCVRAVSKDEALDKVIAGETLTGVLGYDQETWSRHEQRVQEAATRRTRRRG